MSDSDAGDQQILITFLRNFQYFVAIPLMHAVDSQSMNVFLCLPLARLPSIIPVSAMASNLFLFWEEDAGWNLIFGIEAKDTAPKKLNYCYVLLLCHLTAFWAADLASVSEPIISLVAVPMTVMLCVCVCVCQEFTRLTWSTQTWTSPEVRSVRTCSILRKCASAICLRAFSENLSSSIVSIHRSFILV